MALPRRASRLLLVALVAWVATPAYADVEGATATNLQEGDNSADSSQSGESSSGDAVGGQVVGISSSGDAELDATNRSVDVDASSGDATATGAQAIIAGQNVSNDTLIQADITNATATNLLEGDNSIDGVQSADAASGDAIGGQVTGIVTTAGGSASATLDNTSTGSGVDVSSGDASSTSRQTLLSFQNDSNMIQAIAGISGGAPAPTAAPTNPPPSPSPTPMPAPTPAPIACTTGVSVEEEATVVSITCDGPIASFTITPPAGNTFVFAPDPPGYTCSVSAGSMSCTATGSGVGSLDVDVFLDDLPMSGDSFGVTVNGVTQPTATV